MVMEHARSSITLSDSSLLRGTTAAVLLAWFGRRLRATAGGIGTVAIAEDEFNMSFIVPQLDIFFSHSWHARWYLKYFTVLFYFNAVPAVVCSMLCAISLCMVHYLAEAYLPDYTWLFPAYQVFSFGSVVFFLCLFCWQHFLVMVGYDVKSLFLDKVCIHQTDMKRKEQGIKSIGAILGHSDMVLVAWDPSYFTRLWCTFELAAYKYAKPEAPVVVLPVTIGGFCFALTMMQFLAEIAVALLKCIPMFDHDALMSFMLVYFIQSIFCSACFRLYTEELQLLDYQLQKFSVRNAKCFCCSCNHLLDGRTLPCDRKLVEYSIAHWHGKGQLEVGLKKFDNLIQGTFRDDIKLAFRGSRVPYSFVLSTTVWGGFYQIDRLSFKGWKHCHYDKWANMFNSTFLMYPLSIAILINVCHILFKRSGDLLEEEPQAHPLCSWQTLIKRLVDMVLACISTALLYGMIELAHFLMIDCREEYNMAWPGALFLMSEALVVWLLYRRGRKHQEPEFARMTQSARMSLAQIFSPMPLNIGGTFRRWNTERNSSTPVPQMSTSLRETELQNYNQDTRQTDRSAAPPSIQTTAEQPVLGDIDKLRQKIADEEADASGLNASHRFNSQDLAAFNPICVDSGMSYTECKSGRGSGDKKIDNESLEEGCIGQDDGNAWMTTTRTCGGPPEPRSPTRSNRRVD